MFGFSSEKMNQIYAHLQLLGYGGQYVAINENGKLVGSGGSSRKLAGEDAWCAGYDEHEYEVTRVPTANTG
jgi:hypothetical protein